ncbi:phosphotransferase [Actinomadura hibisca]|uniref:phosphotransferase n=1 Tax=Actinomadura hibisca TaxID=68565 RepID=UPI00082FE7B7|nr:phosphotransferase [Actinomadura hibisca]
MAAPPEFATMREHTARVGDVAFWWPHVAEALRRHGLLDARHEPVAGFNATYPTFVYGDVVVKLFGTTHAWRACHAAERAAQALVATDPTIAAPRLLAEGWLFDASWPYLITSRMPGEAAWRADLTHAQLLTLARDVGRQVRRVHALRPGPGIATHADWPDLDVTAAVARSSLPPHLTAQVDGYLARLGPPDPVFTHGDLTANHVYVAGGRLTGIIDWGDAMVIDRHCELIQPYRDLFGCDREAFAAFLAAAEWPVGADFPRLALGHALHRQAVGFAQHHSMDVFAPIAEAFPLDDIATLDELAGVLFAT